MILIRTKKKEYYKRMIYHNSSNPTYMRKSLKEVIRGGPIGAKIVENIDFEILNNNIECGIGDKFNLYYI